jgi:hypothetical protein
MNHRFNLDFFFKLGKKSLKLWYFFRLSDMSMYVDLETILMYSPGFVYSHASLSNLKYSQTCLNQTL